MPTQKSSIEKFRYSNKNISIVTKTVIINYVLTPRSNTCPFAHDDELDDELLLLLASFERLPRDNLPGGDPRFIDFLLPLAERLLVDLPLLLCPSFLPIDILLDLLLPRPLSLRDLSLLTDLLLRDLSLLPDLLPRDLSLLNDLLLRVLSQPRDLLLLDLFLLFDLLLLNDLSLIPDLLLLLNDLFLLVDLLLLSLLDDLLLPGDLALLGDT